ncbi:hypothetical protein KR038_006423 [Drosophila bunnanda]|nr:hypothetical protein KR038_006423 [Drosophila bunnanda]
MAVENSGMLFYTEHRYYGLSLPHGNKSFQQPYLKQLNLHQSLADLAHFIRHQRSENSEMRDSKVILVGGSYSGSLAAWMTQLYPELIASSWASSAPLLAKADFYEYMEMVSSSINLSYGKNCSLRIERGFKHLVKLFDDDDINDLLGKFHACKDYNPRDPLDRAAFFNGLGNYFALLVQSYRAYIPRLCETLMSLDTNDEVAFVAFLELLNSEGRRTSECQDFGYSSMLQLFSAEADQSSGSMTATTSCIFVLIINLFSARAWFYQTCNEFGWYTTTESPSNLSSAFAREVPLSYFESLCRDAFGVEQSAQLLAQGVKQTNGQFGGFGFNQSERYAQVIFTHGQLDPWRALGQQTGHQAIVLTGYSHVEDLASIRVSDSVQMNLAKLRVMSFLRRHI